MIILIHVLIALTSIACSGLAFLSPSTAKLKTSYALVAATLVTGTYLVLSTHSALTPACTAGLTYLAVVSASLVGAHRKLSAQHQQI